MNGRRVPLLRTGASVVVAEGADTALTLVTPFAAGSADRPFDDVPGPEGLLRVPYRGSSAQHPESRALRRAMERGVQLVWLFGVGPASYLPLFPVFVVGEEPGEGRFVVDPGVGQGFVAAGSPPDEHVRRYVVAQTRRRLHQPVFRATVMRAYASRCTVCSLRHERLLDAAHIVPDADPRGIASVRNGLAMCKIHHAAFDADILGIRPVADGVGVVEIRADLLEEKDGPMLLHGLQGHHRQPLRVTPIDEAERPARELLERRYEEFLSAG
ncbi:putative restriction endonuclease [Quadrisphaera granulorum]|uniref:Putative restriction endonuclease n=1 Tax=Quadrisphaera granulorum TaxID=317664 RepID=A0A315ZMR5_9ACTN|nr:HNH endonuclease signature motif containing protein [Quadrisphaera granulorum]PWJ46861.1 putative restriction endonuclease [Quadrisphaera granulorum]SZE99028.1 putative restriction endonuclease [Quadrisphaera granulorum]